MKILFSTVFLLIILACHCSSLPEKTTFKQCEKIETGAGPEDFTLSANKAPTKIFISSHERRQWITPGEIYAYDLQSRQMQKINRTAEPDGLFFAPHGIDLYNKEGKEFLYVISHGKEREGKEHSVLIYEIGSSGLRLIRQITHELFISPNDLAVDKAGNFYLANDAHSRGSFWEIFWGLRKSTVIFCDIQSATNCKVAADKLGMANSVAISGDKVFVSVTREGKVYKFHRAEDNTLSDKTFLADAANADNLFWYGPDLLVASHTSDFRFFRHSKSSRVKSPGIIWKINVVTGEKTALFADDGSRISAMSGAFVADDKLYVSQVFESHMLECKAQ